MIMRDCHGFFQTALGHLNKQMSDGVMVIQIDSN